MGDLIKLDASTVLGPGRYYGLAGVWTFPGEPAGKRTPPGVDRIKLELEALGVASVDLLPNNAAVVSMAIMPSEPVTVGQLQLVIGQYGGIGTVFDGITCPDWALNALAEVDEVKGSTKAFAKTVLWFVKYWWVVALVVVLAVGGLFAWKVWKK